MPQSGFTPIITYNTATASAAPSAGTLTQGELAVNVTDKKIYTKNSGGSVVQVGSGPDATETLTNKTLTSPDINGGTIDGTPIGSTTPAAGSFTTLSASGASGAAHTTFNAPTNGGFTAYQVGGVTKAYLGSYPAVIGGGTTSDIVLASIAGGSVSLGTGLKMTTDTGAVTIPGSVGIGRAPTTKLDIFGVNQVVGIIHDPGSAGNSELKISSAGVSNYAALHFVSSGYIYDRTDSGNAICIGPDTVLANATAKFNTVSGVVEFTKGTFGYGIGAGGTVTQATSKSTAVTLNKPSGQITMNNAALAANTAVAFQVNNSLVAVSDAVLVSIVDSVTSNINYQATISQVTAGAFNVCLRNITGGSLSETVVLNVAIIKGATS